MRTATMRMSGRSEAESRVDERVFLSAEWRNIVMLNYAVKPDLLAPRVPPGTELDFFDGKTFVSLVGFQFLHTKLFDVLLLPFHSNFEEVNLRFYVRRVRGSGGEDRRGVVFIREVVPRRAVAQIARYIYGENYCRRRMRHRVSASSAGVSAEYEWRLGGKWCRMHAHASGEAALPNAGSLEQFIAEHYWGYVTRRGSRCGEYHVSHEPWRVWNRCDAGFEGDADTLYGGEFASILRRRQDSALIAEGSRVLVHAGRRII